MLARSNRIQTGCSLREHRFFRKFCFSETLKKYKVNFSDAAKEDLHEIYDYIAGVSLNRKFSASFVKGFYSYLKEALSYFPCRFPIHRGTVRKVACTKNTNSIVLFEIRETTSEVFVLVVTSAKQYTRYSNLG